MTHELPLGYLAAKHVLELGRSAFFGWANGDLPQHRSDEISQYDKTPQFGYVGARYRETRVLLMGINPGNGPSDFPTSSDRQLMPALVKFAQQRSPESFIEAQRAYQSVCRGWDIWKRHCSKVIAAGRLSVDKIAYSNCLPWRTESESGFSGAVAERAAKLYAYPLIEEVEPHVIIAMGKRAAEVLGLCERSLPPVIPWNCSRAATLKVVQERSDTAARISAMLKRVT